MKYSSDASGVKLLEVIGVKWLQSALQLYNTLGPLEIITSLNILYIIHIMKYIQMKA